MADRDFWQDTLDVWYLYQSRPSDAWHHQTITGTNIEWSSRRACDVDLREIKREIPDISITKWDWKLHIQNYNQISRVSSQKSPTRHAKAWQTGPFWQDTLDLPGASKLKLCWPLHSLNWVMHIWFCKINHHWFRYWLITCSAPSNYPNQCWHIVNWTIGNILKQSGRSPKVVALFSATNLSSYIIKLLQLHDTIQIK